MPMANTIQGDLNAGEIRFGILLSRFNQIVTDRLLEGALDCLERHGADPTRIDVIRVPGSFELTATAQRVARLGRYDVLICLGALIRGETGHYEILAREVCRGLSEVGKSTGIPISFGVLTVDNLEQALERAGGKMGNLGSQAAGTAIEMARLFRKLREKS